jgi:hypothetical protein
LQRLINEKCAFCGDSETGLVKRTDTPLMFPDPDDENESGQPALAYSSGLEGNCRDNDRKIRTADENALLWNIKQPDIPKPRDQQQQTQRTCVSSNKAMRPGIGKRHHWRKRKSDHQTTATTRDLYQARLAMKPICYGR